MLLLQVYRQELPALAAHVGDGSLHVRGHRGEAAVRNVPLRPGRAHLLLRQRRAAGARAGARAGVRVLRRERRHWTAAAQRAARGRDARCAAAAAAEAAAAVAAAAGASGQASAEWGRSLARTARYWVSVTTRSSSASSSGVHCPSANSARPLTSPTVMCRVSARTARTTRGSRPGSRRGTAAGEGQHGCQQQ